MSLGWQTESALLPNKSKPINISGSSLLSLKAIVSQHENKLSKNQSSSDAKYISKKKRPVDDPLGGSNKGVEKRQQKDDIFQQSKDNKYSNILVENKLKAKARIYDDISKGLIPISKTDSILVNFEEKQPLSSNTVIKQLCIDENADLVEIVDQFGRTRKVSKKSRDYADYMISDCAKEFRAQQNKNVTDDTLHDDFIDNSEWRWSKGFERSDAGDWIEDTMRERGVEVFLKDRINDELKLSSASRVKSMWDSALDSKAKNHIAEAINEFKITSSNTDKQNSNSKVVELLDNPTNRRDFIRQKLLEKKISMKIE